MQNSTRTIQVNTTPAYDVTIGGGIIHHCGQHLRKVLAPCHVAVITDSTVASLYLDIVSSSLKDAGFTVSSYTFPAGEANKTMDTLAEILEFLAEHPLPEQVRMICHREPIAVAYQEVLDTLYPDFA